MRPRNYECFYFDITNPKPRVVKSLHTWELMGALTRNIVSEMKLKRKAQVSFNYKLNEEMNIHGC